MLKLLIATGFALSVATSAQGMTPAPLPQLDDMVTQVAVGCGPGRTRVNGVCVARTTVRQTRRAFPGACDIRPAFALPTSERQRTGARSIPIGRLQWMDPTGGWTGHVHRSLRGRRQASRPDRCRYARSFVSIHTGPGRPRHVGVVTAAVAVGAIIAVSSRRRSADCRAVDASADRRARYRMISAISISATCISPAAYPRPA